MNKVSIGKRRIWGKTVTNPRCPQAIRSSKHTRSIIDVDRAWICVCMHALTRVKINYLICYVHSTSEIFHARHSLQWYEYDAISVPWVYIN
jgi:hypothetical protein